MFLFVCICVFLTAVTPTFPLVGQLKDFSTKVATRRNENKNEKDYFKADLKFALREMMLCKIFFSFSFLNSSDSASIFPVFPPLHQLSLNSSRQVFCA